MQEAGASGSQDKIALIIAISRIRMVKGPQRFYAANNDAVYSTKIKILNKVLIFFTVFIF